MNSDYTPSPGGYYPPPVYPQQPPSPPYNPDNDRKHFMLLGLGLSLLLAVNLFIQYSLSYILLRVAPEFAKTHWYVWTLSIIPLYLFALPSMLLFLRKFVPAEKIPKATLSAGKLIGLFLMCIPVMYIGSFVGTILNGIIQTITGVEQTNAIGEILANSPWWLNFIATVIIAPIGEEFIFRKTLIDRIAPRYGTYAAIVFSGLSFGMFHGNFAQFFYAAGLGMVFAYVYSRTGKLRYSIGMHMGINFLGGIVASYIIDKADAYNLLNKITALDPTDIEAYTRFITENMTSFLILFAYLAFIGILFIAGIVAFCILFNKRKISKGEAPIAKGWRGKVIFLNIGSLCFAALTLFVFILNIIPAE